VSPTNNYKATTFRVSQSIGLYIWLYSRQIDNVDQGDEVDTLDKETEGRTVESDRNLTMELNIEALLFYYHAHSKAI